MKAQCRCGKILIIPNDQMGQRGICPRCGNRMLIPSLVGSAAPSSTSFATPEKPPAPPAPSESEKGAPVEEERMLPKKEPEQAPQEPATKDRLREVKGCPFCGEEILTIAIKCKHCGEWLSEEKRAEEAAKIASVESHEKPMPIPFVEMTPVTPAAPATPPTPAPQPRQRTPLPTRPCPTCKKEILSVATLCRHCGSPTDLRPRQMRNPYFGVHATVMFFALVATVGAIFPLVDQKEAKSFFDERRAEAAVVIATAGLLILFGAILSAARKFFSPAYLLGGLAVAGMAVLQYFRYPGADPNLGIGPAIYIVGGSGFTIFLCGIVGFFMKRRLTPRKKEPAAPPAEPQDKPR